MTRTVVNEKNLKGMGAEKLSQLLLSYCGQYPELKQDMRYYLAIHYGGAEDLAKLLLKSIKTKQRPKRVLSHKKVKKWHDEIAAIEMKLCNNLVEMNFFEAYPVLWEYVILGEKLRKITKVEDYREYFSSLFDNAKEILLKIICDISPDPNETVQYVFRYTSCFSEPYESESDYYGELFYKFPQFMLEVMKYFDSDQFVVAQSIFEKEIQRCAALIVEMEEKEGIESKELLDMVENIDDMLIFSARLKDGMRHICFLTKDEKGLLSLFTKEQLKRHETICLLGLFYNGVVGKPKKTLSLLDGFKGTLIIPQEYAFLEIRAESYKALKDTVKRQSCLWDMFSITCAIKDYTRYMTSLKTKSQKTSAHKKAFKFALDFEEFECSLEFFVHFQHAESLSKVVNKLYDSNEKTAFENVHRFSPDEGQEILEEVAKIFKDNGLGVEEAMVYRIIAEHVLCYKFTNYLTDANRFMELSESILVKASYSTSSELDRHIYCNDCLRNEYLSFMYYQMDGY
ncbi:MAG: hypothetical protein OXC44_00010 [Proteobacteria bacterium]|nr:hypothetical protein [Pseudomonadota bacterium]